jgi:hypothetical protein
MELTIEEAYPSRDRSSQWFFAVIILLFVGFSSSALAYGALHRRPPYPPVRHLPWQLAIAVLWTVYAELGIVIYSYTHLFLPLTPVTVEKTFRYTAFYLHVLLSGLAILSWIGIFGIGYTIACTCINAICLAGLLVFWLWIARKYRQVDLP